ncbi:hypothetical protein F9C07_1428193 [Aspergillus flavus]|uniref:Ubiquitin-like domain-containing protein n=1 Tax=Aspergillus flavus (strain ATCC 200026 / FGSC A1120 / IAM 13836 / NRRL 3357 / JCM 12722 / SRRC 167) TaxID=332952 RepID=A0A7U2MLY8_ASPFN|nr:hypothetical protein AFLA_005437 [Aspergillus flavus NRRL3357]QRD86138.1 hypothetical protein F9C07_1428193 [Aspergillus flavus]
MAFNIRIGPSPHGSDHSSLSDEEDSSGVQVSPPSDSGSHDYQDPYDEWAHLPYPDELKPSDSASRPRTSHRARSRHPVHGSSSTRRHPGRRHIVQEREHFTRRPRRQPSPESPESMDSGDEYDSPYGRVSHEKRIWPPVAQGPGYARSPSPVPSYVYPNGGAPHAAYAHQSSHQPPSDQLIRLGPHGHPAQPNPYGQASYAYNHQLQQPHGSSMPPYFHDHHLGHHPHPTPPSHVRGDGHTPSQHPLARSLSSHGPSPYGGPPLGPHDLVPYGPGGYYPFREPYGMVPGMIHPSYFNPYPRVPSPSQVESTGSPPPPPTDTSKDEAIARLEKLILEERTEREAREQREAARQAAMEQEAAEQAAREERAAHEMRIVEEAAARAREEAEQKAAEEAAKAKKEAEEAAAAAAAEAAAAATEAANAAAAEAIAAARAAASDKPPPEKKKPIKFKDAVGRKFSFPFDLCCTWQGMEELIRQAFLHIEIIGPHVAEGHYDLIGPNGDIILPQVWETVIEPDWTITMHMWPIPEKPKTPEPAPPPDPPVPEAAAAPEALPAPEDVAVAVPAEEPKKKSDSTGAKKPRTRAPDPGAFAMWMAGGNRRFNKALKVGKKPRVVLQHGLASRVM